MAYNPSPLDTSPTSTQGPKAGGDLINTNFTEIPNMLDVKQDKDIVNDSVAGVGLYAGGQRLEWTKAFAATTGALVFEITGVYAVNSMIGKMTVTISEAIKPDRVFFIEGRWHGSINNWDEARCIELTESSSEILPIRFSVDTVNEKIFIIIGNIGSTWNNLRIKIDDVLTNWNDTLNLGFVITETIDFTGLTHTFEFNPTRYEVAVKTTVTTTAPTVNDDNTLGYVVWSRWLDTTLGNIYICVDTTTGAAVWKLIT